MDLEDALEKIPSTEKIFAIIWIVSWFLAIWMYTIQFFLTGLFCLFLTLIMIGKFDSKEEHNSSKRSASFKMDKNTRTLKVQKIYENDVKWDDHEICAGSASLPTGAMREGDIVKDCEGNVAIRHIPTNTLFGGFDFEE